MGCYLMKQPPVARAIRDAMTARAERTRIDADRIVLELARMAFSDLGHIADWGPDGVTLKPSNALAEADRAAIAEVSAQTGKAGGGRVHIRLQNKQRALDSLARHFALYGRNAGLVAPGARIDRTRRIWPTARPLRGLCYAVFTKPAIKSI